MKRTIFFITVFFLFAACEPHKPTTDELRNQKHQKDSICLRQQEQTMTYTDSLLQILLSQSDAIVSRFQYIKNERYEAHEHYIHPQLKTTGAGQRTFIQAYILDDMQTIIRSFYYGSLNILHTAITLSVDGIENRFTGENYTFEAEGHHEILTITDAEAKEALQFINSFPSSKIKITLEGKAKYTYTLSDKDREALIETFQLQTVMSDIKRLETHHRQASLQVAKYKKRLEK